ncbi:acyltransferase [Parerythrobacter aurantius]|uniref:acyltransferase family protein n=1 Tax=Parerythrobacter aurantius TaxID=3127706 RepID=UPI00324ACDEA
MGSQPMFQPISPGAFRLLLALLVVVDHASGLHLGLAAVYLFFILSGFWIHRMWETKYRLARGKLVTFYLSRLWRLVPVMAGAMVITVLVQSVIDGVDPRALLSGMTAMQLLSHVFILGYGLTPAPLLLPPAWTLDLEMQFYLLAPLLCLAIRRTGIVLPLAATTVLAIYPSLASAFLPVAPYLVLFVIGMAASARQWRPGSRLQWLSAGATAALFAGLVASGHQAVLFASGDDPATSALNWVAALFLAPVALGTVWRPSPRDDAVFADLSYIIYLVHWPLVQWAAAIPDDASPLAWAALACAVVLLPAVLLVVDRALGRTRTAWVAGRLRAASRSLPEPIRTEQPASAPATAKPAA